MSSTALAQALRGGVADCASRVVSYHYVRKYKVRLLLNIHIEVVSLIADSGAFLQQYLQQYVPRRNNEVLVSYQYTGNSKQHVLSVKHVVLFLGNW